LANDVMVTATMINIYLAIWRNTNKATINSGEKQQFTDDKRSIRTMHRCSDCIMNDVIHNILSISGGGSVPESSSAGGDSLDCRNWKNVCKHYKYNIQWAAKKQ